MRRVMLMMALAFPLLMSQTVVAQSYNGFYLGVNALFADSDFDSGGLDFGGGLSLGYSVDGWGLEYEYGAVSSVDLAGHQVQQFGGPAPQDARIRSNAVYVNYRYGQRWFAKARAGYHHVRVKEDGGDNRVLENDRGIGGGLGVGVRGNRLMLELDYTFLGSDYSTFGLGLSVRF